MQSRTIRGQLDIGNTKIGIVSGPECDRAGLIDSSARREPNARTEARDQIRQGEAGFWHECCPEPKIYWHWHLLASRCASPARTHPFHNSNPGINLQPA